MKNEKIQIEMLKTPFNRFMNANVSQFVHQATDQSRA